MKDQLLQLQSQRDSLRAKLQAKARLSQFDQEWADGGKKLQHLDGLFGRLCKSHGLQLSKFGRLSK